MPSTENRFDYPTLEALRQDAERRGVDLPIGEDVGVLGEPVRWGRLTVPNRLATHPMEGCDATRDGSPSDLTLRRYRRFASGGTGMIWFEACAVVPEARANPRQLHLHAGNVRNFAEMVRQARRAARDATGRHCACVLQLTHSGRYARPEGAAAPVIAHHAPELDRACGIAPDHPLITDGELDALQEAFVAAAELAVEAGFDAVDVKACHGYLFSELLAAHTRENSRYGGSYANRVRMLRETVAKVRHASGERIEVTTRLNAYDAVAHPYGWGVDRDDPARPDLAEPIRLLGQLRGDGVAGASITAGNPYFNPHVNRPAERQGGGEHPLEGLGRFIAIVGELQQAHPHMPLVGSGYSYLRQHVPHVAAGAVQRGWATMIGLGREALAYPQFARDILERGTMDPAKVCITCGACTQIMRDGGRSGCVVRDAEIYAPIYRAGRRAASQSSAPREPKGSS